MRQAIRFHEHEPDVTGPLGGPPPDLPNILHTEPLVDDHGETVGPFLVYFPSEYPFNEKDGVRSIKGPDALTFSWRAFRHTRLKKSWTLIASAVRPANDITSSRINSA